MATVVRSSSSSSVNLLHDSYASVLALAATALWAVLRQVRTHHQHSSPKPCVVSMPQKHDVHSAVDPDYNSREMISFLHAV